MTLTLYRKLYNIYLLHAHPATQNAVAEENVVLILRQRVTLIFMAIPEVDMQLEVVELQAK